MPDSPKYAASSDSVILQKDNGESFFSEICEHFCNLTLSEASTTVVSLSFGVCDFEEPQKMIPSHHKMSILDIYNGIP